MKSMENWRVYFNINLVLKIEEDLNLLISCGQNKAGIMHFFGFLIRYHTNKSALQNENIGVQNENFGYLF